MGAFTRIPADTFEQIQTDAGILLDKFDPKSPAVNDENIICPTTGGITAACEPTFSDMGDDVDNCPANLLELKHLDSWNCHLDFTSLGTSAKSIKLALGAADISDDDGVSKIIPRTSLKTSDAQDIWWVGDKADGGMVAVCLKRALSTSGFSLKTTKSGKGQVSVVLTGHVSVDTQDEVPMEFYVSSGDASAYMLSAKTSIKVPTSTAKSDA